MGGVNGGVATGPHFHSNGERWIPKAISDRRSRDKWDFEDYKDMGIGERSRWRLLGRCRNVAPNGV